MATPSTEERELQLVEKLDFRIINISNNEKKLQELLSKFLAPLLLKGASEHASVRSKVATIAQRLKLFVEPEGIVLPVVALVKQFKSVDSAVVRHLDMVFIQHSIGRLSDEERREVIPAILRGIAKQNQHTPGLFQVFLQALPALKIPPRGSSDDEEFGKLLFGDKEKAKDKDEKTSEETISNDPYADASFVADTLGRLFHLGRLPRDAENGPDSHAAFFAYDKKDSWLHMGSHLSETRIRAIQLLASGAFTDEQRFMAALYAAVHTDSRVSSVGEEILKRSIAPASATTPSDGLLENKALVEKMFAAHAVLPPYYRTRILKLLSRSARSTSAEFADQILAAVKRDMDTEPTEFTENLGPNGPIRGIQSAVLALRDNAMRNSRIGALEITKLHTALFEYVHWVARQPGGNAITAGGEGASSNRNGPSAIAVPLIKHLQDFIILQGWPDSVIPESQVQLRAVAYDTIGMLARSAGLPADEKIALVLWLFSSLKNDTQSAVVVHIDSALSSMMPAFQEKMTKLEEEKEAQVSRSKLRKLLLHYMDNVDDGSPSVRSARHAAVKWANNCLLYSDPIARWMDVLAVGRRGERNEVVEEGRRGLDPWTYYSNNSGGGGQDATGISRRELPAWKDLVMLFFQSPISVRSQRLLIESDVTLHMEMDQKSVFINFLGDKSEAFPVAVQYCWRMLLLTALPDFKLEVGWEQQLDILVRTDLACRVKIREYIRGLEREDDIQCVVGLLSAALKGMLSVSPAIAKPCGECFVKLASLSTYKVFETPAAGLLFDKEVGLLPGREAGSAAHVGSRLADEVGDMLELSVSNNRDIRKFGAAAVGIMGAHPAHPREKVKNLLLALSHAVQGWKVAVGSELNTSEGAFLALGHLVSRLMFYDPIRGRDFVSKACNLFPTAEQLTSAAPPFREALYDALSEAWMSGFGMRNMDMAMSYIELLYSDAKKGNERAITALGRLSLACDFRKYTEYDLESASHAFYESNAEDDIAQTILDRLCQLYELKQVEVHFTIGAAIATVVAGWDSDVLELARDVDVARNETLTNLGENTLFGWRRQRPKMLSAILDKLLEDCKTTKPSLLKASGIWLFTLIQHCSRLEEVHGRLRSCQGAFMRLLSARDELVQETASRGLTLVYDRGDDQQKRDLVKDLVATFTGTGGTGTQGAKVEGDTELFDAGALQIGEGQSVTSYRDIVALANEVGDPSLLYRFMALAANAATWSTRSAFGRFGLGHLLSKADAEAAVDPKLYPKLFRYRFDPNSNVQRSMEGIWRALAGDGGAVVDKYFTAIMEDLLQSMLQGKEWRVRQASCAALADLVQGRPFQQYAPYYEELWSRALRVLDDVKGSVRQAALGLCRTLATLLERELEAGGGKGSGKKKRATGETPSTDKDTDKDTEKERAAGTEGALQKALPFLLSDKGIESGVEDVKLFSTVTVINISRHGGKALRPFVADMVARLLGLLSTIEPQAISYYYLRSNDDDKEQLDKMRSAMVSQSPISEAIENCLRVVDSSVMEGLAPAIEEAIQTAVGMPTKIGCGTVVATLAMRHAADLAPYAARLLRQLSRQPILDRNDEVSRSYAKSAAYLVRAAPDDARLRYADRLVELYLQAEEEQRRQRVADALLALSKISPDHFGHLESRLLPLAYLASHDTDDYVRKAADNVWSKHAGSSLSVARYVPEIAKLTSSTLDTAQWALKHAGALTAADALKAVLSASDLSGHVNAGQVETLWPLFQRAMALRTFDGKERVAEVLPDLVSKAKPLWTAVDKTQMAAALRKMAVVEAKRNNAAYRVHAFRTLWRVAAARDDDMWPDIVGIVVDPYLQGADKAKDDSDNEQGDKMDLDKDKEAEQLALRTTENALDAVARGYNRPALKKNPGAVVANIWKELQPFLSSSAATDAAVRRSTWYKAATDLLTEAAEKKAESTTTEASSTATETSRIPLITALLGSLDVNSDAGTEDQRSSRAKSVSALAQAVQKGVFGPPSDERKAALAAVKKALEAALGTERSLDVQKLLREAVAKCSDDS